MVPALGHESFAVGPLDATVLAFALDETNCRVKCVIAQFSVSSHVTEHV